ncbi:MAG TPA: EAL domain-containing protein [Sporichthyaceae bacterium]|nr:EAL domain-containing protein [Sporichthyaceae bacterium]
MAARTVHAPGARRAVRVMGLVASLIGITVLMLTRTDALHTTVTGPVHLPWWTMVVMFAAAETVVLHLQIQREAQTVSLSEIPLVIGLFMSAPSDLLIGRVVGSFLVFTLQRRQAAIKVAFNTALVAASGSLALAVWSLTWSRIDAGPSAWAGVFAAVIAAGTFDAIATTMAIACYESTVKLHLLLREIAASGVLAAAVGTIGLVAATAITYDVRAAFLVEATGALLLLSYRAYASLRERHESLEQLYHFSEVVSGAHDVDTVLRSVLEQARQLLRADRAEFLAHEFPSSLAPQRMTLLSDGVQRVAGPNELMSTDPVVEQVRAERHSMLLARHTKDPAQRAYLDAHGLREAILVPLHMDGAIVGTLAVANRLGEVRGYDAGDVRLLETVANHAGVALKSGSLIARLSYEAHHDTLTGLPNRHLLQQELDIAIAAVRTGASTGCAVMISDLNGFKEVNDTLGHQHGDELLRTVARCFVTVAGSRALVARLGGDEFAILLTGVTDARSAGELARELVESLADPVRIDGVSVEVSASIGVAMAPVHAEDASGLLKRADVAMYAAKANGGGVRLYDEGLQEAANPSRLTLVSDLRAAIKDGGIEAWVQPKASLVDGSVHGVEALARWRHPVDGVRGPADFLPVAEANGMIGALTEAMLNAALSACASWQALGIDAGVAVNVSPRSLKDPSFLQTVATALTRHGTDPHLLTIEITETSLMADSPQAVDLLLRLSALGVRLSIDDFGTGYSSLAYLRRLPVDEVKLDREFTSRIVAEPRVMMIVRSIADLARNMGISIVAEGVEDEATWNALAELGAGAAQGYHLGRPMPAADFPAWLERYNINLAVRGVPGPLLPRGRRRRSDAAA